MVFVQVLTTQSPPQAELTTFSFSNKAVLNSSPNLPLLMLLIQFLIAIFCLHLSALLTPRIEIPRKMLSIEKFKQLIPILLTNVIGLTFNTLCLRGVDASFFQIARGLVLPLTILVSSVEKRASPTIPVLFAGTVVTLGFFIGIAPKPTSASGATTISTAAPITSLIWGALSSLMTAIHAVLIKRSLPYVDNSAIQLAYWTNASAALMLLPFVLFDGEASSVWSSITYVEPLGTVGGALGDAMMTEAWDWQTFVAGSLITGAVGFLLCVAGSSTQKHSSSKTVRNGADSLAKQIGLLSIKITSPVTHMFSSACRSVLQTLLGVWIFHDILNINRASSILTILGGSMYYTWIKSKEADQRAAINSKESHQRRKEEEIEEGLLMKEREDGSDSMTLFEIAEESDDELDEERDVVGKAYAMHRKDKLAAT
ncbi:hypothetical protein FRB97_008857 [Tulasnella sp. 331]|nr:hypothetical protein FRB97_008857 [Tulasnella sp. 331]